MTKDTTGAADPEGIQGNNTKQTKKLLRAAKVGTRALNECGDLASDREMTPDEKLAFDFDPAELREFINVDGLTADSLSSIIDNALKLVELREDAERLKPQISAELEANKEKYNGLSFEDLFNLPASAENIDFLQDLVELVKEKPRKIKSTGTPKYYSSANTALINALQALDGKGEIIGAKDKNKESIVFPIPVLNLNSDKEVSNYVKATFKDREGKDIIITGKPFEEFDRAVFDAAFSIFLDRKKTGDVPFTTIPMLWRTMNYKTSTEKPSLKLETRIQQSFEKMRTGIKVFFDVTDELKTRGITYNGSLIECGEIGSFMLKATDINITVGGQVVKGYIIEESPLFTHAILTKQIITFAGKLLDIKEIDSRGHMTPKSIPINEDRLEVRNYIIRRLKTMQKDEENAKRNFYKYKTRKEKHHEEVEKGLEDFRNMKRIIRLDAIFAAAGITNKNTKTNTQDFIKDFMRFLESEKEIKSFHFRKKGKGADAIEITL